MKRAEKRSHSRNSFTKQNENKNSQILVIRVKATDLGVKLNGVTHALSLGWSLPNVAVITAALSITMQPRPSGS